MSSEAVTQSIATIRDLADELETAGVVLHMWIEHTRAYPTCRARECQRRKLKVRAARAQADDYTALLARAEGGTHAKDTSTL